jgi:putative salt-induced outer membrane protein YdiY
MRRTFSALLLALVSCGAASAPAFDGKFGVITDPAAKKTVAVNTAALGLALTQGNRDTLLLTLDVDRFVKAPNREWFFGGRAAYGEVEDARSQQLLRGYGQCNHLFNTNWFAYGRLEGLHDGMADLVYRLTATPGAGFFLVHRPQSFWNVEAGPGFVHERFADRTGEFLTARLADRLEHRLNDRARVWHWAEYLPDTGDFADFVINAELGAEVALNKSLSLRSTVVNTYRSEPAAGRKNNDLKLITGVSVRF